MKDIKVKQTDKSIHTLNKKEGMEHFKKQSDIKEKSNEKEPSVDASKEAVDKVVYTQKRTAVSSANRVKQYAKQKKVILKNTRIKERAFRKSVEKENIKLKNSSAKNTIKKRAPTNKFRILDTTKIRDSYSNKMKKYGLNKKQKQLKEATKKTAGAVKKTYSIFDKSIRVTFKVVTKTVATINNLISIGGTLILLVVIALFIGIFVSLGSDSGVETSTLPLSTEVLEHTETIRKYAKESDIEEYVPLIQAVMMQESGGKGTDPMQASECEFNTRYPNTPNTIQDVDYSIQVGVMNLASCLIEAKVKEPYNMQKIYLALQGYNYGKAYIPWAVTHFNGYTRANAKVYSDEMKAKLQSDVYGDPLYVQNVLRYYKLGNGKIVDVALTQVGNVGGKPYWSWYGYESRVEWCATFVSWCADQAGLLQDGSIPKFAYCPTGIQWFKEKGRWRHRRYTPNAGDIIFFDWEQDGLSDHVGIVEKVENGIVHTIEGNSNDECRLNKYTLNSTFIYGYGSN